MKLNFAVFKKGKPLFWILGGIAVFVLFYWIIFRASSGSASGGGTTVVSSGPSDAAIAANTQLAMAQLQTGASLSATQSQNNANVAIATLAAQVQSGQTQAAADVAKYTATLDNQNQLAYYATQKDTLAMQTAASIAQTQIQANYGIDSAKIAAQSVYDQANIQAGMFAKQIGASVTMFQSANNAAVLQSLAAQIPNVKANDRDNMLALLTAASSGGSLNFADPGHSNINYTGTGQPLLLTSG